MGVTSNVVIAIIVIWRIAACSLAEVLDSTLERSHRRDLLLANALVMGLVALNLLAIHLAATDHAGLASHAVTACVRTSYPALLALFLCVMDPNGNKRAIWAPVAAIALLCCALLLLPLPLASDDQLRDGFLTLASFAICAVYIARIAVLSLREYKKTHEMGDLLPALGGLVLIGSTCLDAALGFDHTSHLQITTLTNPIACDMVFLWVHLQITRVMELERLERQRTQLAISQIQPHFLYNSLTTIQSLCMVDPEAAARTTEQFAAYLRQNLNMLSKSGLISFAQELEHTRTYAQIEMTRFPHIEVLYDIGDTGFMLPALSVQPLVENAIRHGVRGCTHGIVRVSSHAEPGRHIVEVRDNGKGFDVDIPATQDADEHIGIRNVQQRVRGMCGGELRIQSAPQEGTCVTLVIPAKEGSK